MLLEERTKQEPTRLFSRFLFTGDARRVLTHKRGKLVHNLYNGDCLAGCSLWIVCGFGEGQTTVRKTRACVKRFG